MTVGKSAMSRFTRAMTLSRFNLERFHLDRRIRSSALSNVSRAAQIHHTHTPALTAVALNRCFSTSTPFLHSPPSSSPTSPSGSIDTVNEEEIAKFAAMSEEWWAPHGPFKMLHLMNPPRIRYIRNRLEASGALKHHHLPSTEAHTESNTKFSTSRFPLQGLHILDVGCGGGLLSEALARLGAHVTGVDASNENVQMARIHGQKDPLLNGKDGPGSLQYLHSSAEKLVDEGRQFDVVCSMEVIEHVDNPAGFLQCLGQLVRPGGDLLLSTVSRTPFAYFMTILSAEHLLRMVPVGTHHYDKYIRPEELAKGVRDLTGCVVLDIQGIGFNPLAGQWQLMPKNSTSPFYDDQEPHNQAVDNAGLLGRVVGSLGLSEASNYFLAAKKPSTPTPPSS